MADIANGEFVLKDSGERQQFSTGARRDTQTGKGRFDLIPPIPLQRVARIFEAGAIKYGDGNWRKGMPLGRFLDSAERHLQAFKEGQKDEDHLGQCIWNLMCLCHTQEMIRRGRLPRELDNLNDDTAIKFVPGRLGVDFDGTCVEVAYPEIGKPLPGCFDVLRKLKAAGWKLILNTCREDVPGERPLLSEALEFMRQGGVEFDSVNVSLPDPRYPGMCRKVSADVYVDDRNMGGFPGWAKVAEMLL